MGKGALSKTGQICMTALLTLILLGTSHALAATSSDQAPGGKASKDNAQSAAAKTEPTLTSLTVQSSQGVSQGDFFVITSTRENTFDSSPVKNEIIFPILGGSQKSVKAQSVTCDGRVIGVLVPKQAQSGEITVKKGTQEIGKVNINITECSRFKKLLTWIVACIPPFIFIIFLILTGFALMRTGTNWLKEALSESEPLRDKDGNLQGGNAIYPPSASRLIAFIGMFGIIVWQFGIIVPALYHFTLFGEIPDLGGISKFIVAQAGIFTPYIANKIAGAFK